MRYFVFLIKYKTPKRKIEKTKLIEMSSVMSTLYKNYTKNTEVEQLRREIVHQYSIQNKIVTKIDFLGESAKKWQNP